MVITSKSNERIKRLASLKEKKYRTEFGEYIVEGFKMVKEAFFFKADVLAVVGTESGLNRLSADFSCDLSSFKGEVLTVSEEVFPKISDAVTPQGVIAVVKKSRIPSDKSRSVLLSGISDPGNMGTIIRTLSAVGIGRLYLVDCCDPYSPKALRSSMSGIYCVDIVETDLIAALEDLKGIPLLVADMDGESVFEAEKVGNFCLVIGGEANGVGEEIRKRADKILSVPMENSFESLNAGVSLGVILYELIFGKN